MSAVSVRVEKSGEAVEGKAKSGKSKRMSYLQCLANAANAARSTGPRTAEGKARSSQNALKHGFRATHALMDEDPAAVEAAHALFVKSFDPRNAAAKAAVDLAFRAKRRLERFFGAEDARVGMLQDEFDAEARRQRARFVERGKALFDQDPVEAVARLSVTEEGVLFLLDRVDALSRDASNGVWSPSRSVMLLAIEAEERPADPRLDEFTKTVDAIARARQVLASTDPNDRLARDEREAARKIVEAGPANLGRLKPAVLGRLADVKREWTDARVDVRRREARDLRRVMDDRKIDDAPETALFERYKSQALSEFHRAMELAMKLCGYKPGVNVTALSVDDLSVNPIVTRANRLIEEKYAPNEPKSDRDDSAEGRGSEGPSVGGSDGRSG